jgi:hypothetical protein
MVEVRALEAYELVVQLGGAPERAARVAELRALFEARAGAFAPDDPWFEERSRAFWTDAVTRGRFGRDVAELLPEGARAWLGPLERAHRGLFRARDGAHDIEDVWSGAELLVNDFDDASRAELGAATDQLFDARVVAALVAGRVVTALLPGAVFHPRDATEPVTNVLAAARARELPTDEALDALLRMARTFRSLSRVKAAYAYRVEALSPGAPVVPVRSRAKAPM